jgi:hypothetical protein
MATVRFSISACVILLQSFSRLALASSPSQNATLNSFSFTNKTAPVTRSDPPASDPISSVTITSHVNASPSTAGGLGKFIAFGFGMSTTKGPITVSDLNTSASMSNSTTKTTSAASSQSLLSRSHVLEASLHTHSNASGAQFGPTQASDGASHLFSFSVAGASNTSIIQTSTNTSINTSINTSDNTTALNSSQRQYNQTYTLSGDCWDQWNQYWSVEDLATKRSYTMASYTTTFTTTDWDYSSVFSTFLSTYTTTDFDGRFTGSIYTTTGPLTSFMFIGTPDSTWTTTQKTSYWSAESVIPNISLAAPSCTLSDIEPQCQSEWDQWVVHQSDAPQCTQAKLNDSFCSSTRDYYISYLEQSFGPHGATMTSNPAGAIAAPIWNASMTLGGPGCTLGCGYCAVQGETVELIYWPPATLLPNVTDKSGAAGPSVVTTMGTVFTSPTVSTSPS